jgi:glycosyltransferase involved in cell wall biosynthesis
MIEDHVHVSRLRRWTYALIDGLSLRRAHRVIAVSEAGRAHLEAVAKVNPLRLELVHNGVDLARFHPRRAASADRPTIGMVAQLTAVKGWHDFLAATRWLAAREPRLRALVVGAGPLLDELRRGATTAGLRDVVEFRGQVEDVRPVLAEMDVFLFTSHREGLSMAVLEAMSCGLPVVATEIGGIREQVLEGVNGFVRDAGDVDGLAAAAWKLLADRKLRSDFGHAARTWVERNFSEEQMVEGYARVYHAITAGERG